MSYKSTWPQAGGVLTPQTEKVLIPPVSNGAERNSFGLSCHGRSKGERRRKSCFMAPYQVVNVLYLICKIRDVSFLLGTLSLKP